MPMLCHLCWDSAGSGEAGDSMVTLDMGLRATKKTQS